MINIIWFIWFLLPEVVNILSDLSYAVAVNHNCRIVKIYRWPWSTGDPSIIELQVTLVIKNYRWAWYYRTTSDPGIIKTTGDPGNINLQVTLVL